MSANDRPNVLFLLSDQHNFRHLSHRFDERAPVSTPALDGLADSGVTFEHTYAQVPLCTPSRMCLLTGREAQRCGAWENWHRLEPGIPTLPETFSAAGYETCLLGKMHLGADRQFVGFDHRPYGDLTGTTGHQHEPPEAGRNKSGGSAPGVTEIPESLLQEANVVRETLAWLREHRHRRERPWLLCASFSRPHPPRTAPSRHFERYWPDDVSNPPIPPEAGPSHPTLDGGPDAEGEQLLRQRAGYLACVDFLDEIIGDLLRLLEPEGFLEDTIVVYTSDHGEMAGERGRFNKGQWFEGAVRVPFIVQTPEHRTGERAAATVTSPVSLADLFPTLCSLTGIDAPAGLDGSDLSHTVESGREPDRGPVVADLLTTAFGRSEFRIVRDGAFKYVSFPEHPDLLFDLETDPHETEDLRHDADHAETRRRLSAIAEESIDWPAVRAARRRDEEELTEHGLGTAGTNELINAYQMPDGRIIDGDSPLYNPHVIAQDPEQIYDDFPLDPDTRD